MVLIFTDKPRDIIFIRQSPHQQQSAVGQTRPLSDAASVVLSDVSRIIQSNLLSNNASTLSTDRISVGGNALTSVRPFVSTHLQNRLTVELELLLAGRS